MKRSRIFGAFLLLSFLLFATGTFATVIEYPLDQPLQYDREIGPVQLAPEQNSLIDIYVQNVYNPARWKEWHFEVWVPEGVPPVTTMQVDYDNTPDHSQPVELFSVNLALVTAPPPWPGFIGYYADTTQPLWLDNGTTPVGSGGPHPWGNPGWVSFHFDVPEGVPTGYYILDHCVPEPSLIALVVMGLMGFVFRRK